MRESAVERKLFRYVRGLGGRAIKLRNTMHRGDVDRILVLPGGIVVWAECKRPGQRARKDQQRVHAWLRRRGHKVLIVDGTNWTQVFTYLHRMATIAGGMRSAATDRSRYANLRSRQ